MGERHTRDRGQVVGKRVFTLWVRAGILLSSISSYTYIRTYVEGTKRSWNWNRKQAEH